MRGKTRERASLSFHADTCGRSVEHHLEALRLHGGWGGSLEAGQLQVHATLDPAQQLLQQPVGETQTATWLLPRGACPARKVPFL